MHLTLFLESIYLLQRYIYTQRNRVDMKRSLLFFVFVLITGSAIGQNRNLAFEYYRSGEYEKAASIYKKLYKSQPHQTSYFNSYIECLMSLENYDEAEREIKKEIKNDPTRIQHYVTLGNLKERQFLPEEADKVYQDAIDNIPPNVSLIRNLALAFERLTKYDLALKVYEKGTALLENEGIFASYLANLYNKKGDKPKMVEYYIKAVNQSPRNIEYYKTNLQRALKTNEELDMVRKQLYGFIQKDPDNIVYTELLQWVFIEKKEYDKALRQARSLDRKFGEDGRRVKDIGDIAYYDGDYETAIKAYEYVSRLESINSDLFIDSKKALLRSKRHLVTSNYDYQLSDLDTIEMEYKNFIDSYGVNKQTEQIVKEFADFLALYKNDLNGAITALEELTTSNSISKSVKANSKIAMGDYYLMLGEIWEATLLYSQVEKLYKEEFLGETARFKNAMLSYYAGNFAWAQEKFSILKTATSKLISNDAIDMSIFIMDNMGLDTTDVPLKMFSEAELYTVQNKYDEAFIKLDSVSTMFPEHSLEDDVIYQKAQLYTRLKDVDKAIELYTIVYEKYPEEIRADNALYNAAEIYHYNLKDLEQAKALYEKLFIDFSNSTFAIEARKRYRILRGDDIQ